MLCPGWTGQNSSRFLGRRLRRDGYVAVMQEQIPSQPYDWAFAILGDFTTHKKNQPHGLV